MVITVLKYITILIGISTTLGTITNLINLKKIFNKKNTFKSFHELGNYDLHAQIEFVGNKTNRRGDIIFVGHSMGTTGAFIYSIDKKKDAERNLRVLIALGPPAYLSHCPHFFDGKYLTYYMLNYGRVNFFVVKHF